MEASSRLRAARRHALCRHAPAWPDARRTLRDSYAAHAAPSPAHTPARPRCLPSPPICSAALYRDKIAEAEKAQGKALSKLSSRAKAAKGLKKALAALGKAGALAPEARAEAEAKVAEARAALEDLEEIQPSTGSIFVRLFLGQVNVKAATSKDR